MDPDLIGKVYESTFFPETWTSVLDQLSDMTDARGGHISVINAESVRWLSSEALRDYMTVAVDDGWVERGPRVHQTRILGCNGFSGETCSLEDLHRHPYYSEVLWKRGLGWGAATVVEAQTGDTILLGFERDFDKGRFDAEAIAKLDALRPHLARAAMIASRLRLQRARATGEALALMKIPAVVLDGTCTVLAANSLAEALTEHIRWRAGDRMSLKDPKADATFQDAVGSLDVENARLVRSFAVRGPDGAAAFVAHLIPVTGHARDIFSRSTTVLALVPVGSATGLPVELVRSLFDLTPAEARIARHLVAGKTVDEIAARGKVSLSTVRTQVRGVLEKTGCRRQAEVVALLGGLAMPQDLKSAQPDAER